MCKQHESDLTDKDEQIKHLRTELEKHTQIAALIHSLSSGKSEPDQIKKSWGQLELDPEPDLSCYVENTYKSKSWEDASDSVEICRLIPSQSYYCDRF